eukprot:4475408-Pyramimonas_sp.AAC.1
MCGPCVVSWGKCVSPRGLSSAWLSVMWCEWAALLHACLRAVLGCAKVLLGIRSHVSAWDKRLHLAKASAILTSMP